MFRTFIIICILTSLALAKNDRKVLVEKIVNGHIAERGEFPFQAAIFLKKSKTEREFYLCGGSIIDEKRILTAAHCLHNSDEALIILGAQDLIANETDIIRMLVDKTNFRPHANFNIAYGFMDIALIILSREIKFNKFIQPVLLPSGHMLDESFSGEIGTVTGFGQFCDKCGTSSLLRYTKNRVMTNAECFQKTGSVAIPSETQVCISTAENRAGSCRGDSGGPLFINRDMKLIQIGVSSFGNEKCEDGHPAIYTRLTREIITWIDKEK